MRLCYLCIAARLRVQIIESRPFIFHSLKGSFSKMANQVLKPLTHSGPTIAVKFYLPEADLLFVGHGPILKVYNYKTSEILTTKRIFKKNKIHGICYDHDTIAFYGARSLSILHFDTIMGEGDDDLSNEEKMVNDWIITGEFSYNGLELYLLTAHNVILSVDSYSGTLQWEKSVYGEKSILYSGSIRVSSKHDVYINAGTVMGGVIIWDLYGEKILHNLQGHQGSIFNVQVSSNDQYIVSCSDDRSIKLWDFKTGELLSTAWGHTARIWKLKFYNDNKSVISVSEDLTSRTWNITEEKELKANLTYELHTGRHIWGLDVNDEESIAATGGNDGRVRIIDINPSKVEDETEEFELSDIVACEPGYQLAKGELVKGFWDLDCGLVTITSEGSVFLYKDSKWSFAKKYQELKGFSLTNGFTKQNIVTFTNAKGLTQLVKWTQDGQISQESTIQTPIAKIINAISTIYQDELYLLVESPNKTETLRLYQISSDLEIKSTKEFVKGPTFVTTCFTITSDLIFIGFRLSSIGIYKFDTCEEIKLIKKVSLSDTVTSITPVSQINDQELILTVTNRDGLYLYLHLNTTTNEHQILHSNDLRKGFVEGSIHKNGELLLYGFKSSYFYIFNESRDYEIGYVNCGGIHRLWKFFPDDNAKGFKFVFIRASGLFIRKIGDRKERVLSDGSHGREVRDLSIRSKDLNGKKLVITGAEDTTLKLSTLSLKDGKALNHWSIRKHTSGLQKVKFLNDNLIVSCSAREELFVWSVYEDAKLAYPLITTIGSLTPGSDIPDLRIMDFDHIFVKNSDGGIVGFVLGCVYSDSTIKIFFFDLETKQFITLSEGRYKTCCLWDFRFIVHEGKVFILTGGTDGFLTVWEASSQIPYIAAEDAETLLYSETEAKISKLAEPLNTIQIHQNGIKDLVAVKTSEGFDVISGGDDNGLGLIKFQLSSEVTSQLVSFAPDAASSTITSVGKLTGDRVLVCSVDQFVRVWSYAGDELKLIDERYTTVADTGSLDVTHFEEGRDLALVGGVGLASWEVKY